MSVLADAPEPASDVVSFLGGLPDGSKDRPFPCKDSETLSIVLTALFLDVRFNLRNRRTEWLGLGVLDQDEWVATSDRKLASLREQIAREFYVDTREGPKPLAWGREAFHDTLNALLHYRERDPFLDYLDGLPEWDGFARLEGTLCNMFKVAWSPLAEWASQFIFLGAVQRTYEPGCKLDEIPVLIGPQGIGKSALLREAVPPDIPDLHGDGLRWDAPIKEQVEAVLGRLIVEVGEMAGRRRADIEHVKSFVTRQDDGHVRLAYARSPESLPRRFILVATTNNESDLPNDPTGNRRFVPIVLRDGVNVEAWMAEAREQLWAEALHLYGQGRRANLPRELFEAQRERAELHRDRDDLIEDAIANLPDGGPYRLAQIIKMLDEAARGLPQKRITRALRIGGWKDKRTNKKRLWTREGDR